MPKLLLLLMFCLGFTPLKAISQELPAYLTEPIPSYHTAKGKENLQNARNKIISLYREAKSGASSDQRKLGQAFGGVFDDEQKEIWLLKASNQGDSFAQWLLGSLYREGSISKPMHGRSVPKNLKKAIYWYEKSAAQDFTHAQSYLAEMLISGEGSPENIPEAIRLLKKTMAKGDKSSFTLLGSIYYLGRGVKKDTHMAMNLFSKVSSKKTENGNYSGFFLEAEKGDPEALYKLGRAFGFGFDVIQDTRAALKYLVASSRRGNSSAAKSLGKWYVEGFNVPKDNVLGYMWLNLCAAEGDDYCEERRDGLSKHMTPDDVSEAQRLGRREIEARNNIGAN